MGAAHKHTEGNQQRELKEERTRSVVEIARKRSKQEYDDIGGVGDESKRQLAWSLNKTAKQLIKNVGKGRFPQHNLSSYSFFRDCL